MWCTVGLPCMYLIEHNPCGYNELPNFSITIYLEFEFKLYITAEKSSNAKYKNKYVHF